MTTFTAFNKIDGSLASRIKTPTESSVRRWTAALFITALLGGVAGLGGLVLWFLTFLGLIAPSTGLYTSGTILIGASFILFGIAAHCLDRADSADKAIRLEYCRQHGLEDEVSRPRNSAK